MGVISSIISIIHWNVDPVIFAVGNVRIGWYGVLLATGFMLAYVVLQKIAKNEHVSAEMIDKFALFTCVWTVVGLRLGHCLFYDWAYFRYHILEIFIPFVQTPEGWVFRGYEGLASHGGTIAIILYVLYFSHKHKVNLFWLFDRIAICIPIAAALVRCGNLMNSEIIGTVTGVPWGFVFERLNGTDECCQPRHPAQLYESLVYLSLFGYQMWYYFKHAKGRIPAGRALGTALAVIFTARFLIEFVKADQVAFEANMTLNMGQWLSIPFIVLGVICLWYSLAKKNYPAAPDFKASK
ncbi:MAG: prolipoprotein diacylglyceryl transferase [Bacteroidales bacterium]|nr:prolipoprotein diacylglyceryl transferase [Bacteroidales bacterium]